MLQAGVQSRYYLLPTCPANEAYLKSESCPAWRDVECNGRDPAEPLAILAELTGGGLLCVSALGTGSWFE
ncbi:hypothetical protein HZ326_1746 [Fusarium oxysporum f. sp. albedinis]|nr:hypothetical protein HZ326_1746 [Fusarium oxysporum f. sp. albedinis]